MLNLFLLLSLPALLVFSLCHLGVWALPGRFRGRPFWRRVALASALAHLILIAGLAVVAYRAGIDRGDLFAILWVWDTVASAVLWAVFGLAGARLGETTLLPVAALIHLGAGTLQWYWIGAGLAAAFERLWESLRTPGDELPDWF
jgi:hypothetical protein